MSEKNGTTRWIITTAVGIILAVSGWLVVANQAAKIDVLENVIKVNVRENRDRSVSNEARLGVIEAQLQNLGKGQEEIKELLQQHMKDR